jgi:serine/threonine protein kinase
MLHIPREDDALTALTGAVISSETQRDASYTIERALGGGGTSVVFTALRAAPDGQTRVVLKILRPALAREAGGTAVLTVRKEAVSLARLNERVPPTPFVVRLIDTGTIYAHDGAQAFELPWTALEYVHGGIEGTTLEERVASSLGMTGSAFDAERAASAIACLAQGITAIHEVGVVHRDLKPANVLCCGFGSDEILKVADFGIARPAGMTATFGGMMVGTPGFAAPEQLMAESARIGPHTDVFAFGCVVYYMLTGEDYLPSETPVAAIVGAQRPERPRLTDARALTPELRARPTACEAIDRALARITAPDPDHRPPTVEIAAALLLPTLRAESRRGTLTDARARTLAGRSATLGGGYTWTARHRPGDDRVVRSVAWESDGSCLAVTAAGLAFWTGISWEQLPDVGLPAPEGIRFIRRMPSGGWLLGGDGASLYRYEGDSVACRLVGRDPSVRLALADGDIAELAVFVGEREGESPSLLAVAGGHWVKPASLTRASSITSIARLDAERWIVTGRATTAEGFAVIYEPLEWAVTRFRTPEARAYLASATRPELGLGLIGGTDGRVLRFEGDKTQPTTLEGEPAVSAVALDAEGRAWAAALGQLWTMEPGGSRTWRLAWREDAWRVPFVSLSADLGRVIGMTADGGILEGRCEVARA